MGFSLVYCSEQDRKNYIAKNYNFKDLAYMGEGIFDVDILKEAALNLSKQCTSGSNGSCRFVTPAKVRRISTWCMSVY